MSNPFLVIKNDLHQRPLMSWKDEFDLCPYAKISNTIVILFTVLWDESKKKEKTECDYFLMESRMLWYETYAVVSLCAVTKLSFDRLRFVLCYGAEADQ